MKGRWWSPSETVTRELAGGVSVVVFDVAIQPAYRLKAARARFPRSRAAQSPLAVLRETRSCSQIATSDSLLDNPLNEAVFGLTFEGSKRLLASDPTPPLLKGKLA